MKRTPRTTLDAAPDNGAAFGSKPSKQRPGRQLGQRIPEDLHQRLVACSQDTDIPMGRLIVRALEAELKRHDNGSKSRTER
jgi:predicted HicB family RNase H-like nuclease